MHGAAAAEALDDMEGYLLAAVRRVVGGKLPILVTLDHHANITKQMVDLADLIVGYETQPHKPYETGKKGADLLFSLLRGEFAPVVAWEKIPLIVGYHERLDTRNGEPMKEWFDLARAIEKKPGVISISNFPMQPWMDIREAGLSTMVYTDKKPELAQELAAELANKAWELRERFWKSDRLPPDAAIKQAVDAEQGPILLADPADTVFGGAPGDSTCLLKEMLRQEIACTALIPMYDPEVVAQAIQAGEGGEITVNIGGKADNMFHEPVEVTGKVTGISDGFEIDPRKDGKHDPGPWGFIVQRRTIVLEVGSIKLLVSENRLMAGIHPDIYRHFGLAPEKAKIIVMKTGTNFQYYESMMKGLIRVDCPGIAQADLKQFDWVRAPRPIYPLDADQMDNWEAKPSVKEQE
jgi:microcystin degradation protein MlrC